MVYESKSAVASLRSYLWKLLQVNMGYSTQDYNGLVPIVALSQQPELMQTGKPFITYGSAMNPAEHLYALNTESVALSIYATDPDEVNRIASLLWDTFKRQDEAAADVNDWLTKEAPTRAGGHRGVYFATVRATMIDKAEPADEEGGFVSGLVMLTVRYTTAPSNAITSL